MGQPVTIHHLLPLSNIFSALLSLFWRGLHLCPNGFSHTAELSFVRAFFMMRLILIVNIHIFARTGMAGTFHHLPASVSSHHQRRLNSNTGVSFLYFAAQ